MVQCDNNQGVGTTIGMKWPITSSSLEMLRA